jgi:acyl CoA:acetate/3-ketoacid CoA transferase beta subunit
MPDGHLRLNPGYSPTHRPLVTLERNHRSKLCAGYSLSDFPVAQFPKCGHAAFIGLTGTAVIDLLIMDLAVFEIDKEGDTGMTLVEFADGVTLDEVKAKTEPNFKVAPDLKTKAA